MYYVSFVLVRVVLVGSGETMINNAVSRWLASRVANWAEALMRRRAPDFVIGPKDDPYLSRWWVIPRNSLFNVYLHRFDASDIDRALHDHPFASVSLALRGNMQEIYLGKVRAPGLDLAFSRGFIRSEIQRDVTPGTVIYRQAKFAHRMVVPHPGALTLFITGPRVREWGFWCKRGWVHWRDFVDARDSGKVGRGCE